MEEEDVGNDSWLNSLCRTSTETVEAAVVSDDGNVRERRPYTQAPMKLPYVWARARQMAEPRQMSWEKR